MDQIQKILIKAGRKDLAQKYYLKVMTSVQEIKNSNKYKKAIEILNDLVKDSKHYLKNVEKGNLDVLVQLSDQIGFYAKDIKKINKMKLDE